MRSNVILLLTVASAISALTITASEYPHATGCGSYPTDVVFLLDASNDVWLPDFRHQLDFVNDVVGRFTIGREAVQVGVVTFADYPQIQIQPPEYDNLIDLQNAIKNLQKSGGYHIHTGDALRYVRELIFANGSQDASANEDHRLSNTTRIMVVITSGLSDDPEETVEQASIYRNADIHLFAVAVGDLLGIDDLEIISSRPSRNYTLQVDSYSALGGIRETLTARICSIMEAAATMASSYSTDIGNTHKQTISAKSHVHTERSQEHAKEVAELKDRTPFMILLGGDDTIASITAEREYLADSREHEAIYDITQKEVTEGVKDDQVGSGLVRNQSVVELSSGSPGGEGWNWRYDEHGSKIWYRIPVAATRAGTRASEKNVKPFVSHKEESSSASTSASTRFPSTYYPPLNYTVQPPRGYWLVDESGNHVWYRYDGPGRYIRDPTVIINRSLSVTDLDGRLTWSGVGDLYWVVDAYGHKVWYKMSRRNDGSHGELFSRIDGFRNGHAQNDSRYSTSLNGETEYSAPHVYLSSGPGGRGGYWAIDEHSHYVWYHYVAPNVFEKDESTATDVMSIPPDYQPQPHQPQLQPPISSKRAPTGELRRRPLKELSMGWGRAIRPSVWVTRSVPGRRLTTPAIISLAGSIETSRPIRSTTPTASAVGSNGNVAQPNRGYWIMDKTGKMTWHNYREVVNEPRSIEQETAVDNDILDNHIPSENIPVTASFFKSTLGTTPTTVGASSSTSTTPRLTTVLRRKTEARDPREKPSGHWTRGKSGKMEWHTFGPTGTTTTTRGTTSTTITTTTTSATTTTLPTTAPVSTTSLTKLTSRPFSTSTPTSATMTSTSGGRLEGRWVIDEYGRNVWRHQVPEVTSTSAATPTLHTYFDDMTTGGRKDFTTILNLSRQHSIVTTEMTSSTEHSTTVKTSQSASMTSPLTSPSISVIDNSNTSPKEQTASGDGSGRHQQIEVSGASNRSVVDALGESLKKFLLDVEVARDNNNGSHNPVWNTENADEMFRRALMSMNDTSIRTAVRDIVIETGSDPLPVTLPPAMTTVQNVGQPTTEINNKLESSRKKSQGSPRRNLTSISHGGRRPEHKPVVGGGSQRGKTTGQRITSTRKRIPTPYESLAWKQFIKGGESDRDVFSVIDSDTSDVIRRQHPKTGIRMAVQPRRRISSPAIRHVDRRRGPQVTIGIKPSGNPVTVGVTRPSPDTKMNTIPESTEPTRTFINTPPRAPCRPRTPLDIVFAIDQRSQSPAHASHLWQIAFSVMSTIRIDDTRTRVRFIPEMINQPSRTGHSSERQRMQDQTTASLLHPGLRTVADIIGELASNLRQETKMASVARRKDEKYRRRIGIYVTDGRSSDTAATVLAVEKATASLGRRVHLVVIGVGPEVSMTQLFSIARGRRDRILTVYTGGHGDQLIAGLRDVSNRLVQLLCNGDQR